VSRSAPDSGLGARKNEQPDALLTHRLAATQDDSPVRQGRKNIFKAVTGIDQGKASQGEGRLAESDKMKGQSHTAIKLPCRTVPVDPKQKVVSLAFCWQRLRP
jgi:hypothetical protein